MWHRFPLSRPPPGKEPGSWRAPRPHTVGPHSPKGLRRNLSCLPRSPTLPYGPVCMPGQGWSFARTPLLILQAPGTKVQSQVVVGFTYLRGGLGTQAMGYSIEHYLQSQKNGTDHTSIDRRLGEDTLAQPPMTQVSAEEGWRVMSKY